MRLCHARLTPVKFKCQQCGIEANNWQYTTRKFCGTRCSAKWRSKELFKNKDYKSNFYLKRSLNRKLKLLEARKEGKP